MVIFITVVNLNFKPMTT